ncbi:MAG TPA: HD domain-containing protein [Longimicrobiales bacterium]|nr:HD domain-containing protein [Longimicrobiales bacterium]
MSPVHPVVKKAAKGILPDWAQVDDSRYAHMERVSALLKGWAKAAGLPKEERRRWRALGFLHDALKNVPAEQLRDLVREDLRDLPGAVLHGPAAAAMLRHDGVEDESLLLAVAYHTLGHPRLDDGGRALYAADFLEPGRNLRNKWRSSLRDRMPAELEAVTKEILAARIIHLLRRGRTVQPETMAMWNSLAGGDSWARASEV